MNATSKERKELAKEVAACLLPSSLSLGAGQQCRAPSPPAGVEPFGAGTPSLGSPLPVLVAGRVMPGRRTARCGDRQGVSLVLSVTAVKRMPCQQGHWRNR